MPSRPTKSLRPNTIEEVYELAQALLNDDYADIKKELGDVLLHILFYAKIGDERVNSISWTYATRSTTNSSSVIRTYSAPYT